MGLLDSTIHKALANKLDEREFDWVEIRSVKLVKSENQLHVELMLDGEDETVLAILDYEIAEEQLRIVTVKTDKRWITEVLQLVVVAKGGVVPLPSGIAGMAVKMLI